MLELRLVLACYQVANYLRRFTDSLPNFLPKQWDHRVDDAW